MMSRQASPPNLLNLKDLLDVAKGKGFAVGSFSPRYTPMILPILRAGQRLNSPLIVQISQKELERYAITPQEFAEEFFARLRSEEITVPVTLHLDHTKVFSIIEDTIAAGFTSVMIDASEKRLEENISTTKEVVEYAHAKGVSVEAELGMIGTTDFIETDRDEELYTDPKEAQRFVVETGVDALAVSVGTAHGVYMVRKPKVDFARVEVIRKLCPETNLVLHGGSGVPSDMIARAVMIEGGGISKVNIATDLEVALLQALDRKERMTNTESKQLTAEQLEQGRQAVQHVVTDKINHFLGSQNHAADYVL